MQGTERADLMEVTKDPVCGMDVTPETAAGKSFYNGQYFYFCSDACKEEFDEQPYAFAGD